MRDSGGGGDGGMVGAWGVERVAMVVGWRWCGDGSRRAGEVCSHFMHSRGLMAIGPPRITKNTGTERVVR